LDLPLGTEKSGKFFPPYQADLPLFSVPGGKSKKSLSSSLAIFNKEERLFLL